MNPRAAFPVIHALLIVHWPVWSWPYDSANGRANIGMGCLQIEA